MNHCATMNPTLSTLLEKLAKSSLSAEEESELVRELTAAYHADERAASSRELERIAEKISQRIRGSQTPPAPASS